MIADVTAVDDERPFSKVIIVVCNLNVIVQGRAGYTRRRLFLT